MKIVKCFITENAWYKEAVTNSKPVGILWHDTAAGNAKLSRYVQPSKKDENYNELIATIGKHKYNNHWNIPTCRKGVNAFIGKLADGSVGTIQIGEWDKAPWGCGSQRDHSIGSCNGYKIIEVNGKKDKEWLGQHWIQFEICDDGYKDETYFKQCVEEACQLTAYLCKLYGIDPNGTVDFLGVNVPTILCHKDAYKLKLGSDHSDTLIWFKKFKYSMDKARARVVEILKADKTSSTYKPGRYEITGNVNLRKGSNTSTSIETTLPKGAIVDVTEVDGTWGKTTYNEKTGYFGLKYGKYIEEPLVEDITSEYQPGLYEITGAVNLREGPSTNTKILTTLQKYSIVEVVAIDGTWGKITYNDKTGYFGLKYAKYISKMPELKAEDFIAPELGGSEIETLEKPIEDHLDVDTATPSAPEEEVVVPTEAETESNENISDSDHTRSDDDQLVKKVKGIIQRILDFLKKLFT